MSWKPKTMRRLRRQIRALKDEIRLLEDQHRLLEGECEHRSFHPVTDRCTACGALDEDIG